MNKKILIVDDEKEIVDLLEVYLSNDGYSVYKCYNGLEAMKCIKQSQIDLAILDIMLPDIDGFRLCQKIREKFYFPIIMLTAKIEDSDKIMGLTIGADDYITKPFNPYRNAWIGISWYAWTGVFDFRKRTGICLVTYLLIRDNEIRFSR